MDTKDMKGGDLIAHMAAVSCADVTLLMAHEWIHAAKAIRDGASRSGSINFHHLDEEKCSLGDDCNECAMGLPCLTGFVPKSRGGS